MNISDQEIKDLYELAPCGFHALDPNGVFLHVNQTELDWLGYHAAEMIGRMKLSDILTLEGQHKFEQNFQRFKSTGPRAIWNSTSSARMAPCCPS